MRLIKIFLLSVLFNFFTFSSLTATEVNTNSPSSLVPIILTLKITDTEKNNSVIIKATQDKILTSLKEYKVENVQRFQYSPLIALSIEQAGLDFLKTSDYVHLITYDGLNMPDRPQQEIKETVTSPCLHKKQLKDEKLNYENISSKIHIQLLFKKLSFLFNSFPHN